ncbi:LamG domain-containing protein [Streptomyces sp. TRM72054]|nr:LamG domain-containing protein [Streptomyces sp. TRM72054]MBX9394829.1 LamG domain-containing protein [Streptomyces sp. TRM72054]
MTVPGTAHALDNLPPRQPLVQDLQTGTKACAAGEQKVYVGSVPTLSAVLYDPEEDNHEVEANLVKGEFEAWWTDAEGVQQRRTYTTYETSSGTRLQWRMPADDIPADTVISWHVRANDGIAVSPWSSEGDGAVCEFVYDDDSPATPVVTSPDFAEDELRGAVGEYGSFVVDSASDDVVEYVYSFIGGPQRTAHADELGGPVTIRHLPLSNAPDYLRVRAIDRSGRSSASTTYFFRVNAGRAPIAHWTLADPAGSTTATAQTGPAARAGSGVTFGAAAPHGTSPTSSAELDGSRHAFLTPDTKVADLDGTFAVSAWARPARTDRTMTVASQDAGRSTGFTLGLRSRDDGPEWSFTIGGTRITGGAPETGEWAHLLGLYDAETGQAQLYVNGREVGTPTEAKPTATSGAFQIGRARHGNGYRARWHGELSDIRAYDRVVVPDERTELAHRRPTLLGHWSLETATDGVSPEQNSKAPLTLGPGASIHRGPDGSCIPDLDPECPVVPYALVGDGHLQLDGTTGYAATADTVLDTSDSFTVGVVVRLADAEPERPMTVLSQAGKHTDAFKVRYDPSVHAWQLVIPQNDEAGAPETVVSQIVAADGGEGFGHHLAVVYDDATDQVKLYLDGYTNAGATATLPDGLPSTGALQVGRAAVGDGWGEYLRGDVDEIQAYAGALRDQDVPHLGSGGDPCLC